MVKALGRLTGRQMLQPASSKKFNHVVAGTCALTYGRLAFIIACILWSQLHGSHVVSRPTV